MQARRAKLYLPPVGSMSALPVERFKRIPRTGRGVESPAVNSTHVYLPYLMHSLTNLTEWLTILPIRTQKSSTLPRITSSLQLLIPAHHLKLIMNIPGWSPITLPCIRHMPRSLSCKDHREACRGMSRWFLVCPRDSHHGLPRPRRDMIKRSCRQVRV
jgi:hypothetical protein